MNPPTGTVSKEQAVSRRMSALEDAFEAFSEHTVSLQRTYRRLKEEAARVNQRLDRTNQRLQAKVRELDELANFQRSILSSVPVAVLVTDLKGYIRTFNPAAEQLWDVCADEAIGRSYREVLGPHCRLLERVLCGPSRREDTRRVVEDENRIISSTASLVEDSKGRPIGAVQLDQDITRVTRLEEGMCRQQKLADLGKMAAGFAHEVKKPLNGIKGFASILRRRFPEDEEGCIYADRIMEAAERLNRMLGRVTGFARPGGLDKRTCDLKEQADSVADFIRFEDPHRELNIQILVPEGARFVLADADKLQQILLNLMKNAAEATDGAGEVVVQASREHQLGGTCVCIRVADDGPGIPKDILSQITEPFVTKKEGGAGLGLAVVDRLLKLHGSKLSAESEAGVGTIMEFALQIPEGTEDDD